LSNGVRTTANDHIRNSGQAQASTASPRVAGPACSASTGYKVPPAQPSLRKPRSSHWLIDMLPVRGMPTKTAFCSGRLIMARSLVRVAEDELEIQLLGVHLGKGRIVGHLPRRMTEVGTDDGDVLVSDQRQPRERDGTLF